MPCSAGGGCPWQLPDPPPSAAVVLRPPGPAVIPKVLDSSHEDVDITIILSIYHETVGFETFEDVDILLIFDHFNHSKPVGFETRSDEAS